AACGLCVGVGCFSDTDIQGVANLFKHMVFMKSEKYSEGTNFKTFIEKRGGFVDVLTDSEQTTFYFAIQEKYLFPALDRFAQGFIKPLMTKDIITRERKNICEYELVPCDEKEQLSSAQTDSVNKYTRESFSNMDDDKLCKELNKFRNRYYNAHRMTLAIQARLSLSTLEKFVTKCFVDVPNNTLSPDDYVPSVSFDIPQIEKVLTKTKSHISHVMFQQEITWAMPVPPDFYNNKSHEYIAWIIRHGGKGSLTSYLRKKMPSCIDLCDNVQCDSETFLRCNCIYIMLKLTDPHKRIIYYDFYKIMEYNFRFINEEDSVHYVVNLCKGMHFYPPRDYITANELICIEYNPEDIQKCLNYVKPETAIITILQEKSRPLTLDCNEIQTHVNCDEKERIYIEVPKEYIEQWESIEPLPNFHLPLKNVFIASDFSLISSEKISKYPKNIHVAVFMEMYCRALNLLLFEELYPAVVAGFEYYIYTNDKGIIIKINGFTEKLPHLLITIAKYIVDYPARVTNSLFESCKMQLLDKEFYSKAFMNPHALINDVKLSIMNLVYYTCIDKHTALSNVNFEEFQHFVKSFTDQLYIQCLVQGNIMPDDAFVIIRECLEIINCGPLLNSTVQQMRVMQIPLGISYCKLKNIDKMNTTSIVTNYYQVDVSSLKLSVLLDLMMEIMFEKLHIWKINKTKLFKVASCDLECINGILGYSITTYTNKCTTNHMDEQIEAFLQLFNEVLRNLQENDLDNFKAVLIIAKKHEYTDNVVKNVVNRNWSEITMGTYVFDRYEREVFAINDIKVNDLKKCFAKNIIGSNLKKLSIHVVGNNSGEIAVEKENIENPKTEHFTLEYISDDEQEIGDHHIDDIERYKKYLYVYPFRTEDN
ncbi:NRDC protein, partial [Acromyrmex heyeri]